MPRRNITAQQIDHYLPQTQCRDCGYNGCLPYAEAIVNGDSLNKCLPGGKKVLVQLGKLLHEDITEQIPALEYKSKPKRLAIIREAECIGCTKCIQACPVDAIIGSAKQMHTVLETECTGCGLCIVPCPMDCIDLEITDDQNYHPEYARIRYHDHQQRCIKPAKKASQIAIKSDDLIQSTVDRKKEVIAAAIARVNAKKK